VHIFEKDQLLRFVFDVVIPGVLNNALNGIKYKADTAYSMHLSYEEKEYWLGYAAAIRELIKDVHRGLNRHHMELHQKLWNERLDKDGKRNGENK